MVKPTKWAGQVLELGSEAVFEDFDISSSIPKALIMHGAFCFALQHTSLPSNTRNVLDAMAGNLEAIFEDKGLTPPPDGWRSPSPEGTVADRAGVDGSRPRVWVPSCRGCVSPTRMEPVGLSRSDKDQDLQVWVCRRCVIARVVVVCERVAEPDAAGRR